MGNTLAILSGNGKESLEPWDHKVRACSNFSNEQEEFKNTGKLNFDTESCLSPQSSVIKDKMRHIKNFEFKYLAGYSLKPSRLLLIFNP